MCGGGFRGLISEGGRGREATLFPEVSDAVPIFEYYCPLCHRIFNFLVRSTASHRKPRCPKCGGGRMERRFSRFAAVRSEDRRADDLAGDPDLADIDEKDPRALGRMMRKMGEELGEDLGPEFGELVGRLEAGEDPEKIEEELGDVFGDEEDGAAGGRAPSVDSGLYDG